MKRLALLVVLGASACTRGSAPDAGAPSAAPSAASAPSAEAELDRARDAAVTFATRLRARLLAAMGEGGPARAVEVCAQEAPAIAGAVSAESGALVGRASLRTRSPRNAAPPPWVKAWLVEQGERPAAGAKPIRAIEGGEARVLLPIAVEGPCLACHGPEEGIAEEVRAILAARYPSDAATGYAEGDLRGALWAVMPRRSSLP